MAGQEAICSIRMLPCTQLDQRIHFAFQNEAVPNYSLYNLGAEHVFPGKDRSEITSDIRLKWVKSISDQFFDRQKLDENSGIRDWDFILSPDGEAENHAGATSSWLQSDRVYPAQYRAPHEILEPITSNALKVQRAELFALGGLLYEVLSGKELLGELGGKESGIESRFREGEFPDDVWALPHAVRVLACWCPQFAENLLAENQNNKSVLSKVKTHIKQHPILFGIEVTGGILSLTSLFALPILGAVGFGAAGPAAGSVAAGWQAGLGLVKAGSIFSWCQSAAMGGAAVSGIVAAGLAGVGVTVSAVVAGAVDDVFKPAPELKEMFLVAWRKYVDEAEQEQGSKLWGE